ncbi:hypothetical protein CYMTET_55977 [Cymbomonas tetramitiformis]|uniref:Uncharacterized protein n=1 Tax=Cymbomonas tetramitiformis TaxID=36881 RepID=A0AAE0BD34_9CHLO|nr:hypothetical protein CYMTET_55977 [Cymbomonas tetramitiformis]
MLTGISVHVEAKDAVSGTRAQPKGAFSGPSKRHIIDSGKSGVQRATPAEHGAPRLNGILPARPQPSQHQKSTFAADSFNTKSVESVTPLAGDIASVQLWMDNALRGKWMNTVWKPETVIRRSPFCHRNPMAGKRILFVGSSHMREVMLAFTEASGVLTNVSEEQLRRSPAAVEGCPTEKLSGVDARCVPGFSEWRDMAKPTIGDCDHEDFPEAAYAEGEDHADDYTPEEWAAWEAGAYESFEDGGGAEEEYVEHFDGYDGKGYYSDDY